MKANIASPIFTGTVQEISKAMVGLSNVQNIAVSTLGGTNINYNTTTDKLDLDTAISLTRVTLSGNYVSTAGIIQLNSATSESTTHNAKIKDTFNSSYY